MARDFDELRERKWQGLVDTTTRAVSCVHSNAQFVLIMGHTWVVKKCVHSLHGYRYSFFSSFQFNIEWWLVNRFMHFFYCLLRLSLLGHGMGLIKYLGSRHQHQLHNSTIQSYIHWWANIWFRPTPKSNTSSCAWPWGKKMEWENSS